MSPWVSFQASACGASDVVVGQGVAGAPPEGGGTEGHQGGPALVVALLDLDLLDVGGPFGVPLEVGRDGEAPLGRCRHRHVLVWLDRPRPCFLPVRAARSAVRQTATPASASASLEARTSLSKDSCTLAPGGPAHPPAAGRVGQQAAQGLGHRARDPRAAPPPGRSPRRAPPRPPRRCPRRSGARRPRPPRGRRCRTPPAPGRASGCGRP